MGLRLRLKRSYSLQGFSGQALAILKGLRRYGMFLAGNGSPLYISGAADRGWNDADLDQLRRVPATAFEAVKTGSLRRQ
jgi:hypothetical protein